MKQSTRHRKKDRARPQPHERRPLVLIIDDDHDTLRMYTQYLEYDGFQVITASNGEAGVTSARQWRPAAIVMDLQMQPLDGWEATRRLKRSHWTANIPVIACTGHFLGTFVERALEAGCDAYVVKPCLPADLARELRTVLTRPVRRAQA